MKYENASLEEKGRAKQPSGDVQEYLGQILSISVLTGVLLHYSRTDFVL
jgi:hypothetical protein